MCGLLNIICGKFRTKRGKLMNQYKEFCADGGRKELICSKLCKTSDLGVNGNVFGGRILEWLDEAGGIFAAKKIGPVVTIKVSEVLFKVPVHERDIIDIIGYVKAIGTTSITLELDSINITTKQKVCTCEIKFVHVDEKGEKLPIPDENREKIKHFYGLI